MVVDKQQFEEDDETSPSDFNLHEVRIDSSDVDSIDASGQKLILHEVVNNG